VGVRRGGEGGWGRCRRQTEDLRRIFKGDKSGMDFVFEIYTGVWIFQFVL